MVIRTWTQSRLEAAKELALEAEDLSDEEREQLDGSLDDIVADTPRTQLAASRFKRLMAKAGKGTGQAMREIVVQIATEAAKRSLVYWRSSCGCKLSRSMCST